MINTNWKNICSQKKKLCTIGIKLAYLIYILFMNVWLDSVKILHDTFYWILDYYFC